MSRMLLLANPRSGSTYFCNLLNSHPEFRISKELLNTDYILPEDPISFIQKELSTYQETYIGLKVQPRQIIERGLRLDTLVKKLGVTTIIIIWRENFVDSLASLFIAFKTGEWYSSSDVPKLQRIEVPEEEIKNYAQDWSDLWKQMAEQWPCEVSYIFVRYEDLLTDRNIEMNRVLNHLGCRSTNFSFCAYSCRQNPAKSEDKISNWNEISEELRKLTVNVPAILKTNLWFDRYMLSDVHGQGFFPERNLRQKDGINYESSSYPKKSRNGLMIGELEYLTEETHILLGSS